MKGETLTHEFGMFLSPIKFDIVILNVLTFYSASLSHLDDLCGGDRKEERCSISDAEVQTVDDKFLDFKKCHSRHRCSLKVNSLSGEFDDTS